MNVQKEEDHEKNIKYSIDPNNHDLMIIIGSSPYTNSYSLDLISFYTNHHISTISIDYKNIKNNKNYKNNIHFIIQQIHINIHFDCDDDDKHICFHVYGVGYKILYEILKEMMNDEMIWMNFTKKKKKKKGGLDLGKMIFDSCIPCPMIDESVKNIVSRMMVERDTCRMKGKIGKICLYPLLICFVSCYTNLCCFDGSRNEEYEKYEDMIRMLCELGFPMIIIYRYSKMEFETIEYFIEKMKSIGTGNEMNIEQKVFESNDHVKHIERYQNEYLTTIEHFLNLEKLNYKYIE